MLSGTQRICLMILVVTICLLSIGCAPDDEEAEVEIEPVKEPVEIMEYPDPEGDITFFEEEEETDEPGADERTREHRTTAADPSFRHEVNIVTDAEITESQEDEWWIQERKNGAKWWKKD